MECATICFQGNIRNTGIPDPRKREITGWGMEAGLDDSASVLVNGKILPCIQLNVAGNLKGLVMKC